MADQIAGPTGRHLHGPAFFSYCFYVVRHFYVLLCNLLRMLEA